MITVLVRDCNISQSFYDSVLNSLQLQQLVCPHCRHSACLSIHGYYSRMVKAFPESLRLRVMRVRCSECRSTHAILPSSIVPYSQIPLSDQHAIVQASLQGRDPCLICDQDPSIDENNVKAVVRSFRRHWKQKLLSLRIPLVPVLDLISSCFSNYSSQFMQVHRMINILFASPT